MYQYKIVRGKTLLPLSTTKLPEYRLYLAYPFENVGLYYTGPLFTRDIFVKSTETFNSYILIFTCATTRKTHLELVPSESSVMLLLAVCGFIARKDYQEHSLLIILRHLNRKRLSIFY